MAQIKRLRGVLARVSGECNGIVQELTMVKSVSATLTITKEEEPLLGQLSKVVIDSGWAGTGTITSRYGSRFFRDMAVQYTKTGELPYFSLVVENVDPNFPDKPIRTRLGRCKIDEITLANADDSTTTLTEEIPFTFEEWEDM